MKCLQVLVILVSLGVGELTLVSFVDQRIDPCLNTGTGAVLNERLGVIQGHRVTQWLEETVEDGRRECLAHGLVLSAAHARLCVSQTATRSSGPTGPVLRRVFRQ